MARKRSTLIDINKVRKLKNGKSMSAADAEKAEYGFDPETLASIKARAREMILQHKAEQEAREREQAKVAGKFDIDKLRAKIAEHAEKLAQEEDARTLELVRQGVKEALTELVKGCPHCGLSRE